MGLRLGWLIPLVRHAGLPDSLRITVVRIPASVGRPSTGRGSRAGATDTPPLRQLAGVEAAPVGEARSARRGVPVTVLSPAPIDDLYERGRTVLGSPARCTARKTVGYR